MLRLNLKFSVRFVLIVLTVLFLTPATTGRVFAATAYQKCLAGTSCVVGEYLYNDSYVPITGATCTFTSRNPDGSLFVSSAAMTSAAENDGWYSYAVDTTGKDNGIYRSQICCTSGAEYMCLDKTYEIGTEASLSSSDVTSAVWDASVSAHTTAGTFGANLQSPAPSVVDIWGYSDRSLTSFGSLISDMWSYSTRSLSSFSNIVTAVWSNATRTLTAGVFDDGSKIATQNDVQVATNSAVVNINANSDANTSALTSDIAGVQSTANTINGKVDTLGTDLTALTGTVNTVNSTVNTINTNVNTLTTNLATISTNVGTLLTKWGSYSATDIITNVGSIQTNIGSSGDGCAASTLFGYAHCAKDKWGVSSADDLLTATNNVATLSAALRAELNYNGKSTTAYEDLQTLLTDLTTVTSNLGTVASNVTTISTNLDTVSTNVLGVDSKIDTLTTKVDSLTTTVDGINTNVNTLITKWGSFSISDVLSGITTVQNRIGTNADTCLDTTVFGYLACINDNGGNSAAILTAATNAATQSAAIRAELNYNGKSTTAYEDLQTLLTNLGTLTTNVGTVSTNVNSIATNVNTVSTNLDTVSTNVTGVDTKLTTLTNKVDALTVTLDSIAANVNTLLTKWGVYSITDVLTGVSTVQTRIGTSANTCVDATVFGAIACIADNGGDTAAILSAATNAATQSAALRAELNYNGKSTTAYEDMQTLLADLGTVSTNLNGVSTSIGTVNTNLGTLTTDVATVDSKLTSLTNKVDSLILTVGGINTNINTLITKWGSYSMADVITSTTTIQTRIGSSSNVCGDLTVFGYISCIDGSGGNSAAILAAAETAASQATALRAELDFNGKSTTAYTDLQTLKSNMTTIQTLIGSSSDSAAAASLFGSIKKTQEQISVLDTSGAGLTDLLSKWGSYTATDIYDKVKDLSAKIDSVNTISNVSSILTLSQANATDMNGLKNSALELVALTRANKRILEDGKNVPIITSWLEEGSIIFKTLITNPSSVRHDVPIKFYLPKEASLQDVMKIDKELTTAYDPSQDALYVSGQFSLGPGETKIVAIEMTDIWKISPKETESLRLQAQELFEPLKNTAFFAQGATLKSDVTAALDTADQVQAEAQTPEARIKAYRAAVVEVNRAKEDISNLKSLVTQASSSGTLVGFVGGVQTLAVWGLVIILTTGFVFLALYMRMLTVKQKSLDTTETATPATGHSAQQTKPKLPTLLAQLPLKKRWHLYAAIAGYLAVVAVIAVSFFFVAKSKHWFSQSSQSNAETANTVEASPAVIAEEQAESQPQEDLMLSNEKQVLGASVAKELVTINAVGNGINMRELPDSKAKIVKIFHKDTVVEKLGEQNGWVNVSFDPQNDKEPITGWVSQEFIVSTTAAETSP